jgi:PhoH-like ATPase
MMRKTYVLDTNVLLEDPTAIARFKQHLVVLPYEVLQELENQKTRQDLVGQNAREVIRELDALRQKNSLSAGVEVNDEGGTLQVVPAHPDARTTDEAVILHATRFDDVEIITNDIALRVLADVHGVSASVYEWNGHGEKDIYSGVVRLDLVHDDIRTFYDKDVVELDPEVSDGLLPHEVIVAKADGFKRAAVGRHVNGKMWALRVEENTKVGGLKPRNREQQFALDMLLDDEISLVTLIGKAGCGKSLMAVAAGLEQIDDLGSGAWGQYDKLLVSRPIQPMGRDLGYLPGTEQEKMKPWLRPINDALHHLLGKDKRTVDMLFEQGTVEIEALTYIRGRSIPNCYMIVDEAQNLSVPEMKAVVTRMGPGSKLVVTGDIEQIDNHRFDSHTNGLAYLVEKMKGQQVAGHITLIKGERSELATIAAEIL